MMDWLTHLILAILGLAWGLAVGSGLVAFITVLDIIPRLMQITKTATSVRVYEYAFILGACFWAAADLFSVRLHLSVLSIAVAGALCGVFVGMLAAALTEVLNVLPILARRLRVEERLIWLLLAMVCGKVLGSLFEWLFMNEF
ncbi:MAG TPA: stage V sporulation protein AB [Bacilli bacterium]